jgi:hypothetical protein
MSSNGSGLRETLLKNHHYEDEDSGASAKRKADVEKWAAMLAAGAAQAQPRLTSLGHAPDGWRGTVAAMTPASDNGHGADSAAEARGPLAHEAIATGAASEDGKLQVRVNIGELGELALVVERLADGVKVQISAQDSHVLEMLSLEQDALAAALSDVGHSVTSLSFVKMDRFGIKLAPIPRRPQRAGKNAEDEPALTNRKSRRVNVIG